MAAQGGMAAPGEMQGLRGTWDFRVSAHRPDHRLTEMVAAEVLPEAVLAVRGPTPVQITAAAGEVAVEQASPITGALEEL